MKLRVLHCLQKVDSGGPEVRRLSLARGLDRERYEQRIVCTQALGGLPPKLTAAGVRVDEIGTFRGILDPERYRRALKHVTEFRPHIIHGAVFEGVATATVVGTLARVPIVIAEETSDPVNRSLRANVLFRSLTGLADHVIAVSPATERYLRETIHIPARKITMVMNGVRQPPAVHEDEVARLRASLGIDDAAFVVGTVGRLHDEHKRQSDLIRSLPTLYRDHPGARVLIVGAGDDDAMLRKLARDLGVTDRVLFVGYQANPAPYYQLMDVFALTSQWEAFGLVLVEAMFAGLPVVATRVGGIPSIVLEGETGLLVPPRDPSSLTAALCTLAHDKTMRQRLGSAGRMRAATHFTDERYVRDIDNLYQGLAREHHQSLVRFDSTGTQR